MVLPSQLYVIRWQDGVDFFVLAAALYLLIRWAVEARALRIALGVIGLHAAALLARHLDLVITGWVFEGAAAITVVFLLVVFQPEIRVALARLDRRLRMLSRGRNAQAATDRQLAEAAFKLAGARTGALLVIVRHDSISELTVSGIPIGATVSAELIEAIFLKSSPLHDGAVVVEGARISKARVFLPLTHRRDFPNSWGSRHRAAMGLAERSDSVVLVVSEQTGDVHMMEGREIRRMDNVSSLVKALSFGHDQPKTLFWSKLRNTLFANFRPKVVAVGLALVLWATSSLFVPASVRSVTVPVEFDNVPAGLVVAGQSASELRIQVRGSEWLLDSIDFASLIAHLDLSGSKEGWRRLSLPIEILPIPHGLVVERVSPQAVSVRLARRPEGQDAS